MPPPNDGQQTGWIAAGALAVGATLTGLFTLFRGWIDRNTALKSKEIDHDDEQLKAIVVELTNLRSMSATQQNTIAEMLSHRDAQGEVMKARGEEVSHLKNEIERMQIKIERLEARESEYEKVIAQKDALIAEQSAMIASLEQRIADFEKIGAEIEQRGRTRGKEITS